MGVRVAAERSFIPLTPSWANKALKASFVGANTVKLPEPFSTSASLALVKSLYKN